MHPFAYALLRAGPRIALAPNDDSGHDSGHDDEPDDGDDDFDEDLDADAEEPDEDEEPGDDDEAEDEEEPPASRSRGESRQAKLARELKEVREQLNEVRNRPAPTAPQQPQETQEQFNARVNAMEPLDRVAYLQHLSTENTTRQLQAMQFQLQDGNDQLKFDSFCNGNPQAKKLAADVEKRLQDYRKNGMNIPRMDVLKHLLGEKSLASLTRSTNKAKRSADGRREAQRAKPNGSRGDAGREGRGDKDTKSARDRRLENMKI